MRRKLKEEDIVLSRVVKWYLLFIGDFSTIKQPLLKRVLTLIVLAYQFTLTMIAVSILSKPFSFSPSELVNKTHGVVMLTTPIASLFWWWNRALLRETVYELTERMIPSQVPVESRIRRRIIAQCKARHLLILWVYSGMTFLLPAIYTSPPIISYLMDSSPDRRLSLPLGMFDPFSCDAGFGGRLGKGLVYFLCSVCFYGFNYVCGWHGSLICIIFLDSLKELFYLSKLAFLHLGNATSSHPDHILSAIQFHQRSLRLSSKVKALILPMFTIDTFNLAFYDVFGGVAVTGQTVSSEVYIFIGGMITLLGPNCVLFLLPASTTHKAEEIALSLYTLIGAG